MNIITNISEQAEQINAALNAATKWVTNYFKSPPDLIKEDHFEINEVNNPLPMTGKSIDEIMRDFDIKIKPGINFWTHPGFMGYFNSSVTPAGLAAELLSTAINANCMSYVSNPAGSELERLTINWVKDLLNLDSEYFGVIYEGGSSSNFHAMAAARCRYYGDEFRLTGATSITKNYTVYFSNQTHASIKKAASTLGIGLNNCREIDCDNNYTIKVDQLIESINSDRTAGYIPLMIIGNIGTTSTAATDNISALAKVCKNENIWFHIDASHGGILATLEEKKYLFDGWDTADSITINPHKWMFVPLDLSILFIKEPNLLEKTFSISAEYLKNPQNVDHLDYMNYGLSLGRKFRSLKLWFTMNYLGVDGYKKIIRYQLEWTQWISDQIYDHPALQLANTIHMSTICFSINAQNIDLEYRNNLTKELLNQINKSGHFFLTHTVLNSVFNIRIVISNYFVTFEKVKELWNFIDRKVTVI